LTGLYDSLHDQNIETYLGENNKYRLAFHYPMK